MNDYAIAIASMSLADFRTFKAAYRTLTAAGIVPDVAIQILVDAYLRGREARDRERVDRRFSR